MNRNFKMPKLPPKPTRYRYSDGFTLIDSETAHLISQRYSNPQINVSQHHNTSAEVPRNSNPSTLISPQSSVIDNKKGNNNSATLQ